MLPLLVSALLAVQVWVADESDKVLPGAQPPSATAPRLRFSAAGGECTGAQLVVRGPVRALTVRASGLPLELYRVATLQLRRPSGPDGRAGEWPDALIPARDAVYGEARNAFPVDVPQDRAQPVFVEACVPRGRAAGRSAGAVELSWKGGSLRVPVELRARGFDLPVSLATAFGFSGYSAAKGHGKSAAAARELTRAYDEVAVRRGITLFGGTQDAPAHTVQGDAVSIDWRDYDAEVAPFLDGRDGARWTSVELREPRDLTRPQRRAWRRAWVEHFRARGWLSRLFAYVEDEPAESALGKVEDKARELREDAPAVRRLVTTAPSPMLPSVDLPTPLVNCVARDEKTCPRTVRGESAGLWWYQSCMSHGCTKGDAPSTDPAFSGWPSYAIDAPGTAARAMGVLAYANGIAGELYYDVVYAYDHGDAWTSQWAFGGNGDGTLFYPGTPERIGGQRDVPVESLRLVQISRGLSDHAYLALLSRLGDSRLALAEARALAPSVRGFSRDPRAYAAMRERVSARIETLLARGKGGTSQDGAARQKPESAQLETR